MVTDRLAAALRAALAERDLWRNRIHYTVGLSDGSQTSYSATGKEPIATDYVVARIVEAALAAAALPDLERNRLAEAFIRGIEAGAEEPTLAGDGDAMYSAFRQWAALAAADEHDRAVLCSDGSRVHDFKGERHCPGCGWGGIFAVGEADQ